MILSGIGQNIAAISPTENFCVFVKKWKLINLQSLEFVINFVSDPSLGKLQLPALRVVIKSDQRAGDSGNDQNDQNPIYKSITSRTICRMVNDHWAKGWADPLGKDFPLGANPGTM